MKRFLAAAALLMALAQPHWAQVPDLPITPRFLFPVSLLCGSSSENLQEGVVRGRYNTVVHLMNPSSNADVLLAKSVVRSLPYQDGLPPGTVLDDMLEPGASMAIECNELRQMQAGQMAREFRTGYLVVWSDGPLQVSVAWSGAHGDGEVETLAQADIGGRELCPFEVSEVLEHAYAERICLPFSWTCDDPDSLSLEIDGEARGAISLARTEDHLLGDGSSTFCASTLGLEDGTHWLVATLACEATAPCQFERQFEVANTPFRLLSARADRKRYRGSDTVRIVAAFSESLDALEADFTILDTGFEEDRLSITATDTPGTYIIEYNIDGFDNTNLPGLYPVQLTATDQGVTRQFRGLRVGYVGATENLLAPVDDVATSTIIGTFPTAGTSELVEITGIVASNDVILPLTSLMFTGTVAGDFVEGRPRTEAEALARNMVLIWRERDTESAGAYRLRPAMLELDCAEDGDQVCTGAEFSVELGFPARLNDIAKEGPHNREIRFALIDPDGGVSEAATADVQLVVLSEEMYAGTPQSNGGASQGGTVGAGVGFRLGESILEGVEGNPLTLVLTWEGETGPGAEVIPGEDGNPQTLTAVDLNIGLHRAQANGHGGWFGNLGNAELVRKSNTCFSGLGLGQFSDDRWNCVCSDASQINMEVITYPPEAEFDEGSDGAGTFGAEYYIYDSCGAQEDTTATLTAYYCGSAEQHTFEIEATLSEENEELDQNWNNPCPFGAPCHDPKDVPTGFNETGGFYQGFDFNPTDCSILPVVQGHVSYLAPVNAAENDPEAAPPSWQDEDPMQDQSWRYFDENLNETDWTRFDVPFALVEVYLVDGTEALVGETYTDEDGNFSLILPADYAEGGISGEVRVDLVALSAPPHSYRVVPRAVDVDSPGTAFIHRAVLADGLDPVTNAGAAIEVSLNDGPDDETSKQDAAAFHIFRNGMRAAQHMLSLGRLVPPYPVVYSRSVPTLDDRCQPLPTVYTSDFYTHIRSLGEGDPMYVCTVDPESDGPCAGACVPDFSGDTFEESRADFAYDTHMHEYLHHVLTQLSAIGPQRFEGRAEASHFRTTSEKTSLTEGIAEALGISLVSKEIFGRYGPGVGMHTTQISCNRDDIIDCDLGLTESIDWLTTTNKGDGTIRPGPDWQPQKDCAPGMLGCGCFLGTCSANEASCEAGYCVDTSGTCTPGSLGCAPGAGCTTQDAAEVRGICVLPVTYSDGWTWRLIWDMIDEGEDVQPEASHWRTSQMSDADPAVPNPYDTFGDPEGFWRLVFRVTGIDAVDSVTPDLTHPNLADLVTQYRCDLEGEDRSAFDVFLEEVVEFPYHDPTVCP